MIPITVCLYLTVSSCQKNVNMHAKLGNCQSTYVINIYKLLTTRWSSEPSCSTIEIYKVRKLGYEYPVTFTPPKKILLGGNNTIIFKKFPVVQIEQKLISCTNTSISYSSNMYISNQLGTFPNPFCACVLFPFVAE